MTEKTTGPERPASDGVLRMLSDIRVVIGGLFCVYGVIVTGAGFFDSEAEIDKAQGLHINLWAGLAMLVFGAVFLTWAYLRPTGRDGDSS